MLAKAEQEGRASKLIEILGLNKRTIQAADNAIKNGFHPEGLAIALGEDKPGPLKEFERRYTVDVGELDPAVAAAAPGRVCRVCIENTETKETRCEVKWDPARVSFFFHMDRGSSRYPGQLKCFSVSNLRGDILPDYSHKKNDAYQLAWWQVGLGGVKLDYGLVFNMTRKPFKGCSNFWLLRHASQQFFSHKD